MKTLELLHLIKTPFIKKTKSPNQSLFVDLYKYALKNKMPMLYLNAINTKQLPYRLEHIHKEMCKEYFKTLRGIKKASQFLQDNEIPYTTFKTVRPYESTTSDIDIIIFGHKNNYAKAIKALLKAGYDFVCLGPWSTTLWDRETNIGIDVYEQIAVSYIVYLDKQTLSNYRITKKLPNEEYVTTLKPEADLICIVAHSLIKEQMYTLSEYFTFVHYLKQMNIEDIVQLAKRNNIISAVRTHASITALLHKTAHRSVPIELQQILDKLGREQFEQSRLVKNNFKMPHKYHPITIAKSLVELTKGEKSRKSMATQMYQMLHPSFTMKPLKVLIEHIMRETY